MTLSVTSPAFEPNQPIPALYTCEGDDISPPLAFSGVPERAQSLVLIVDDPDAPDPEAPRTTWVHWVLYDLPPDIGRLSPGMSAPGMGAEKLPAETRVALNSWSRHDYGGPCPPIGRHRYFHKVYALNTVLGNLGARAGKAEVEAAMEGRILATAELIGTYQKSGARVHEPRSTGGRRPEP